MANGYKVEGRLCFTAVILSAMLPPGCWTTTSPLSPVKTALLSPDLGNLHSHAYELLEAGRKDAALAAFEKAVELNPTNGSSFIQLGRLVSEIRGNDTEAILYFHMAMLAEPASPAALSNFAFALENWCGESIEAEKLYRKALSIEPENVNTLNNLASLIETEQENSHKRKAVGTSEARLKEARDLYERALGVNPHHVPTLSNYAGLLQERGPDEAKAASLFQRALQLEPSNAEVIVNYGVLMEDWANNQQVAQQLYSKAIALRPSLLPASARLGRLLRLQGRFDQARTVLKKAFHSSPSDREILGEFWRLKETERTQREEQMAKDVASGGTGHPKVVRCSAEELEDLDALA